MKHCYVQSVLSVLHLLLLYKILWNLCRLGPEIPRFSRKKAKSWACLIFQTSSFISANAPWTLSINWVFLNFFQRKLKNDNKPVLIISLYKLKHNLFRNISNWPPFFVTKEVLWFHWCVNCSSLRLKVVLTTILKNPVLEHSFSTYFSKFA